MLDVLNTLDMTCKWEEEKIVCWNKFQVAWRQCYPMSSRNGIFVYTACITSFDTIILSVDDSSVYSAVDS